MSNLRPTPRAACLAGLLFSLLPAGCGKGPAFGTDNAIIAVLDPSLREGLEPVIREALEREVFTTRPEPVFEVTFTTPAEIGEFRRWRRILIVEPTAESVLLDEVVDVPDQGPVVAEVEDAWARNQTIWVVAGETPAATGELVRARIDSLYGVILTDFLEHHVDRMWASGRDSALAGRLLDSLGFSLLLPRVYETAPGSTPPGSRVWYNEDPRRVIAVHWLPRPDSLDPDSVLSLRRDWGRQIYPQDTIPAEPSLQVSDTRLDGRPAVRLQGVWQAADGSGAGLFLTYGVICGERLILLDGNVYAPERNKVPFLFQLERIFATFRCAGGQPAGGMA
ncbi:MAG TPA: DUF4837 family protein [Gemmatimonadota bacterium]|nr:DUF4837 family protein [Gemmatimonadota bacterium]